MISNLFGRSAFNASTVLSSGRRSAPLIVVVALLAQLLVLSSGAEAGSCKLEPVLQDVRVTQGTGRSAPLVWGKDTLVRPYLTAPECAPPGALKFSNATMKVLVPGGPATGVDLSPVSIPPVGSEPTITDCCVPAIDSTADPIFLIDGETVLSPNVAENGFVAAFQFTVTYIAGSTITSTTFLTVGNPAQTIAATFGKKPNPLRILVVPMGDKAKADQHYTASTHANVQTSIEAVSRMYPLADVVATSTAGTGGLRWEKASGMLDLGVGTTASPGLKLLDGSGKFCGDQINFPPIKTTLANFLQAFNSVNTTHPADLVVGAVDASISYSSAAPPKGKTCYDGIAAYNSRESWFRVAPDGSASDPSYSGAVLGMEIGHNFGMVNDARADSERHSTNVSAVPHSGADADHAYNLTKRSYVANDKTVMHYFGIWNRENTLLEKPDWVYARCRLGGAPTGSAGCTGVASYGSTAAAAPQNVFRISGSTDGTKAGTKLISNFTDGGAPTDPDPNSHYNLIFRSGTEAVQTFKLPVSDEFSHSHDGGTPTGGRDGSGVVDAGVLVDSPGAASHVQIWNGNPVPGLDCDVATSCIYEAELTVAPELDEVQINPTEWIFEEPNNFTKTPASNEIQPSLSFDGKFLAYVQESDRGDDCGAIVVERVDKSARATLGAPEECRSEPSLAPDNETLVFVRDGDLWRIKFDPETLEFDETTEKKIYACVREAGTCFTGTANDNPLTGPASAPAYSPSPTTPKRDQWVVFAVDGDIFRLFPYRDEAVVVPDPLKPEGDPLVGITQTERITGTPETDSEPSVAPDGQRIVFTRRSAGTSPTLFIAGLPEGPLGTISRAQSLAADARHPAWGGNLIAFESTAPEGNIGIVNPDDPSPEAVTTTGTDTWPSVVAAFGKTMAIQRTQGGQQDIYLGVTGKKVDILLKGRDMDNAPETAGYIYVHCGGAELPIAVDATPHHPDPTRPELVTFSADNHDPSFDCGPGSDPLSNQGKASGLITDDWSLSNKKYSSGTIRNETGQPIPAIQSPAAGSALRIDTSIPLEGSGWDSEGRILPGSALSWELQLPGTTIWQNVGTGNHVDATQERAGLGKALWPLGSYKARLTASDGTSAVSTIVEFNVSKGRADFDPNTLYVPSSGNDVVAYVTLQSQNLSEVSMSGVQLVELGGYKLGVGGNPAPIPANKWSVSGTTGSAKFNRLAVTSALSALGLVGDNVEFVMRIQTSTFTFHGVDVIRVEPGT